MGAGCSSPLRRFGGKRAKPTQRDSISDALGNEDDQEQLTIAAKLRAQDQSKQSNQKFVVESEITIQSEYNDDHPSTASYYTNGKNTCEDVQLQKTSPHETTNQEAKTAPSKLISAGAAAAKAMGLSGSFIPHDRHLLVSPALSPAPSICQSPGPPLIQSGSQITLELNDLNAAFQALTFGVANIQLKQRIKLPSDRQDSNMHNYYTQQLMQTRNDLSNFVSVIFFSINSGVELTKNHCNTDIICNLTSQIETNFKIFCDENSFNLRFIDLSLDHLRKSFRINNLQDVAMKIFEQEYRENCQRVIVIVLANNLNSFSGGSTEPGQNDANRPVSALDNRLLPTKIDAQMMNRLLNFPDSDFDPKAKTLLKQWYNQVGNTFYLNPIYLVNPKILSEIKDESEQAWKCWLSDSKTMVKAIAQVIDSNQELSSSLQLKSLIELYIDYITKDSALQKRTLLIRNYLHGGSVLSNQQQPGQLTPPTASSKLGNLNDLARLLADPNKLTLKRILSEEEFSRTIVDWVLENLNKFVEMFSEARIVQGKFAPPFIERNLFIELTSQRHHLEHYLDNITEGFEAKIHNFYLNQIRPIIASFSSDQEKSAEYVNASDKTGSQQSIASQPSANHLVLISGPKRCGKTTLFAQIVKHITEEFCDQAQIIYRFCGLTLDSYSPNRLLRSICEQFCQTQGENTTAASYIYSCKKEVINSLNKIIKQQNSIILLDGLDNLDHSNASSLDWLCELEADPRIKIFIILQTDSKLYKKVLSTYSDATFISLDNPTTNELAQTLAHSAKTNRYNSAGNIYEEITKLCDSSTESNQINATMGDISDMLSMCRIKRLNNEQTHPELSGKKLQDCITLGTTNIYWTIFKHLQYILTPYQLCSMFVAFHSSRYGLSEQDFANIFNLISRNKHKDNEHQKFSGTLLSYVKIQLQPWLRHIICDKTIKMMLSRELLNQALDQYIPSNFPTICGEIQEILLEYYSRPFKQLNKHFTKTSGTSDGSNQNELKGRISQSERVWLSSQASEVLNLLILTNPSKAKDFIMNKQQFYAQFLYRFAPEEFIEDFDRLRAVSGRKLSHNEEIQHLVNYIRQSIFSLRYDGTQIYSQIYCRAYEHYKSGKVSKSKKFNDILTSASCPPIRNLLPVSDISIVSFIRTRIGLNQPPPNSVSTTSSLNTLSLPSAPSNQQKVPMAQTGPPHQPQLRQKIFTIKDNHRHVIVIYPDKSSLSVWDIFEEKAVRTINNIDQPRDLRMIDQKRAVILCNRELRVYDLDSGTMLTKLKGVMNQKMPFFEVFGEDYVIALARNRMYVNMLNLNTGELETTFKVGEDRFLNSLLVSANGGICVCGDETQKPFPLLVWNLNERRLMYDLRLDKHEFITRMSAISDDGHFVVSVCRQIGDTSDNNGGQGGSGSATSGSVSSSFRASGALAHRPSPNFIVIYDLNSGTLFKKWKPGLDTCGVAISISANRSGKVMNTMVDSTILIWDLATGSKRHTLIGHSAPADVIRVQNGRLFSMDSTCRDQSLRIWDIEEGYCLAVFSPDAPVSCCQMSTNGDALVCGFAAETRLSTLVLCKSETAQDVVKRNKRRKSSKSSLYIFDESPSRKSSS